jgi:hypothetical protein
VGPGDKGARPARTEPSFAPWLTEPEVPFDKCVLAEAETAFRMALQWDAGHPLAQVNLATLMMLMGRQGEARPMLTAALSRSPP